MSLRRQTASRRRRRGVSTMHTFMAAFSTATICSHLICLMRTVSWTRWVRLAQRWGVFGTGMGMGHGSTGPSAGGTGFKGYHSQIAGDLISGASSNTGGRFGSGPAASSSFGLGSALSLSLSSLAGMYESSFSGSSPGFGIGPGGVGSSEMEGGISGLGLEGITQSTGIHPMQLHARRIEPRPHRRAGPDGHLAGRPRPRPRPWRP